TFFTPEEQILLDAKRLASLLTGEALLYRAGQPVAQVQIPYRRDPYARTPKFAARKEAAFLAQLLRHPAYGRPAEVLAEQQHFLRALLVQVRALSTMATPSVLSDGGLPQSAIPAVIDPPADSPLDI